MRLNKLEYKVEIPAGVEVTVNNCVLKAKGKKGEVERDFYYPNVSMAKVNNEIIISGKAVGKKEKAILGSIVAHTNNIFRGVQVGHVYRLKICSGHFPMTVQIQGVNFTVKNFFGEKVPRILKMRQGVAVKQEGDFITVEGVNLEVVSQTAASIEQLMRITNRDRRVFQDGIYIISKDGKEIK